MGPLIDEGGNTVSNDNITANILNGYFSSVFTHEVLENIPGPIKMFERSDEEMLSEVDVSREAFLKKAMSLYTEHAPGADNIVHTHKKMLHKHQIECVPSPA